MALSPSLEKYLIIERCPHCRIANPSAPMVWETQSTRHDNSNHLCWRVYQCGRCGRLITAYAIDWNTQVLGTFPFDSEPDMAIPDKARQYLAQAMNSLQAPAGAVLLAASAVDEMLKQKNYKTGSLNARIDKAQGDNLITKDMASWAHQVRLNANDQRHADEDTNLPGEKDARLAIEFASALAEFLFVLPSRVTRGVKEATQSAQVSPKATGQK